MTDVTNTNQGPTGFGASKEIIDELSRVRNQLSKHADLIDELQSSDASMEQHMRHLDQSVLEIKNDMRGLAEQGARTEASLRAFRSVQTENHKLVMEYLADIRDGVSDSMVAALKSTPATIRIVLSILGLLGTAVFVALALHGSPIALP